MFQNILQSSFESSQEFKNILHYSSDFFEFPANSRKFYIFLVNSKIFQMFLDSFIANRDRQDIPVNRQKYESHLKTFLSVYLWQLLLLNALVFLKLVLYSHHSLPVEFVLAVKDHC